MNDIEIVWGDRITLRTEPSPISTASTAPFRQSLDLVQHRFKLLLVIWRLNHIGRNDQQGSRVHHGLSVVALLEAAARSRHDARVRVGEIDLVLRQQPFDSRRGRLAAGLLAGRGGLGRARREFGLVLGPFTLVALARLRLDPRARLRELG
jgi:hypothetical protein